MEEKDLDRLFRQKLDTFEATPSSQAWQQLEQNLQPKKERKVWPYLSGVAACLLLLIGIWGAMELGAPANTTGPMAIEETPSPNFAAAPAEKAQQNPGFANAIAEAPEAKSKNSKSTGEEEETLASPIQASKESARAKQTAHYLAQQSTPKQAVGEAVNIASVHQQLTESQTTNSPTKTLPELSREPLQPKNITIAEVNVEEVISLPEEEKIIIHYNPGSKNTITMASAEKAASNEEKEFSGRKLLGFFKKVTNNNTLADLRDAKDQLLSLDRLSSPE